MESWKKKAAQMKWIVKEKKEKCWRRFCEEHAERDPWEIVKWAKDPWKIKESMRDLKDKQGRLLETDQEKADGLNRDLFGWDEEGRAVGDGEEEQEGEVIDISKEQIRDLVFKALAGTSNTSSPGTDGISYKLIKKILPTGLGQELIEKIVDNLYHGRIPPACQQMKVVMIPKPGRDLTQTKNWRPINLINCIGNIGEKVVADQLQDAGLLHKHQYESVKGRCALEVVF